MDPLAHHVVVKAGGRRPLATTTADRRLLARLVVRLARPRGLLAFCAPDGHMHLVVQTGREEAGELARALAFSIGRTFGLGAPFERSWIEPIAHHGHLHRTVIYALGQHVRHRVQQDPLRESSLLPELLGLRVVGADRVAPIHEVLPRLEEGELLAAAGWGEVDPSAPVEDPTGLCDAAASAVGLADLSGGRGAAAEARRAAIVVGLELVSAAEVSRLLGCPLRSMRRLRASPADPALVRAIRRQLAVRSQLPSVR